MASEEAPFATVAVGKTTEVLYEGVVLKFAPFWAIINGPVAAPADPVKAEEVVKLAVV
jgi:hypothetical protein